MFNGIIFNKGKVSRIDKRKKGINLFLKSSFRLNKKTKKLATRSAFAEKVRHMAKMGVPKNRIVKEATPYVAKITLSNFDPNTTSFVYIFGNESYSEA